MIDDATLTAIRFGHGLPLPAGAPVGVAVMLDRLAGPDVAAQTWPGIGMADALPLQAASYNARRARRTRDTARDDLGMALRAVRLQANRGERILIARSVGASDGFRERLVRFWSDHFTTVRKRPEELGLVLAMGEDAIRPNITGRFADLLVAATLNPSMLLYLDQQLSVGPNSPRARGGKRGLNENLARELIELHTLGVGADYTQTDVRQMAELLTGLVYDVGEGQGFLPRAAEPGPETVLGEVYGGRGMAPILAVLQDLALRPETAAHLARKLAVHFVSDTPDPDLTTAMTKAYLATGGDLMAVYGAMLNHPKVWAPALTKAKQPYDFIVSALRALGVGPDRIGAMTLRDVQTWLLEPMARMGQPMHRAPGPDGWREEAEAWINPPALAARISWAMQAPSALLATLPEPGVLAEAALGPLIGGPLRFALSAAENRHDGVGLVFASAEFNRR